MDMDDKVRAFERLAGSLALEAVARHGVPDAVAAEAARITVRRLSDSIDPEAPADVRRAGSYFWGVIRRLALRGGPDTAAVRARYLAAALVDDMVSAGHGPERILEEVSRHYGGILPARAIESCRSRATRAATGAAA